MRQTGGRLKAIRRAIGIGLTVAVSSTASARPMAIVPKDTNLAWWIRPIQYQPTAKSVGGYTLVEINAKRGSEHQSLGAYCFAEQVERDSYMGVDRETSNEISETFKSLPFDPFNLTFSTKDGSKHNALVFAYESCDKSDGAGVGIMILSLATHKIEGVWEWLSPVRFLEPVKGGLLAYRGCQLCDDYNVLYYDSDRKHFYFESEGD